MKALVVGGGLFGITAAVELAKMGVETSLFESRDALMLGASSINQNRLHLGFHYPRSLATAKQCLEGLPGFMEYFSDSVIELKKNYYAIGKKGSRVTYDEYIQFCNHLKLAYKECFPNNNILNKSRVEGCILTKEPIIDLKILKNLAVNLLKKSGANIYLKRPFKRGDDRGYDIVVNCAYSSFNIINNLLNLPTKMFRYDQCNVPIIKLSKDLSGIGITIMDGDFYSILPYGNTGYHLFWSVKSSAKRQLSVMPPRDRSKTTSSYKNGYFVPLLRKAKLVKVLRTTKILRPDVELSDERITDLINYGSGRYAILSAKVNTSVLTARKLASLVGKKN